MHPVTARGGIRYSVLVATLFASVQCGGDPVAPPMPAIAISAGNNQSAVAGAAVGVGPAVRLSDAAGAGVPGVIVTFAVATGGGSVSGATQTTNAAGLATAGSWVMGTAAGTNSLTATAAGATGSPVTFTATATAGPPAIAAANAGNGQSVVAGGAVPVAPSVKITDAYGNPVAGVTVTFAIASGGGSVAGASQTTNASGVAIVGSWTPGTVGANTLTATAAGLTGSPVIFAATGTAGPPAKLALATAASATAPSRVPFAAQPVVQIQDANGNAVAQAGTIVTAAISAGGGILGGTTTATTAGGAAAFTDLSISGAAGARTLTYSATGLASVTGTVTVGAGAASTLVIAAGNNQSGPAGVPLAVAPSVKVADADGNGVPGVAVTFQVESGGGAVTGSTQATSAGGIATVESWTLGHGAGTNTMTATAAGLTGSPVRFTATAVTLAIASISPGLLTPGASVTIAGRGFGATTGENLVTVDGVVAGVTAATPTQLSITVPTTLPCTATHDGTIVVTVNGAAASATAPLQVATQRALGIGESLILSAPADIRCNELAATGGRYYVDVYNTNSTYSTVGATFLLRGAAATGGAAPVRMPATTSLLPAELRTDAAKRAIARRRAPLDDGERLHLKALELTVRVSPPTSARNGASGAVAAAAIPSVGDQVNVRLPDLAAFDPCNTYYDVTARVAYVGMRSIILEDITNPVRQIDSIYSAIGREFDQTMFPILEANFGSPLVMDPLTDNNQRETMVFTHVVNDRFTTLAGFVVACDLYPRGGGNLQSNFGEYFYARVPVRAGTIDVVDSPPNWRWKMRSTVLHESKHLASRGARAFQGAAVREESWLEESTARIAEELYERSIYGFAQRSNIGYGSAGTPVGPWCDFRACNGNPRVVYSIFQALAIPTGWFSASESHSPLGRLDGSDFSFYATGWSLVRWAIDHSTLSESAFLTALTQETSRSGVANLVARTGRPFADMLPEWSLANVMDDHPAGAPTLSRLRQPSWNLRDVFQGMHEDSPMTFAQAWPFVPFARTFGAFTVESSVLPGTSSFIELSGVQSGKQLLELKASGSAAGAPPELRIAIVRVQ